MSTQIAVILDKQQASFRLDGPPDAALRRNRIDRLMALVLEHTEEFVDAMVRDFGTRSALSDRGTFR